MKKLLTIVCILSISKFAFATQYIVEIDKTTNELKSSYTLEDGEDIPVNEDRYILSVNQGKYTAIENTYKNGTYGLSKRNNKVLFASDGSNYQVKDKEDKVIEAGWK